MELERRKGPHLNTACWLDGDSRNHRSAASIPRVRLPFCVKPSGSDPFRRRRPRPQQYRSRRRRLPNIRRATRNSGSSGSSECPAVRPRPRSASAPALDGRASYIGRFGDDDLGELSRTSLTSVGVDISRSKTVAGRDEPIRGGARRLQHGRTDRVVAPARRVDDRPGDRRARRRHRRSCTHRRLPRDRGRGSSGPVRARSRACLTIVDVEKVRPAHRRTARCTSTRSSPQNSFPASTPGHESPGRALEALADEFRAPLVCVTLGKEGSLARCGGVEIRTPAFSVRVRRQHGRGRRVSGRLCRRHACGRPTARSRTRLSFANAVAALNCRRLGARGGIPTAGEVEQLLYASRNS